MEQALKRGYPYQMSSEKRARFLGLLKVLKPSESFDNVVRLLGPPDHECEIRGKPPGPLKGVSLTYYLKKCDRVLTNEIRDEHIDIVFDRSKRLVIVSTNIVGLSSLLDNAEVEELTPPVGE
jgi:hypothetical protein